MRFKVKKKKWTSTHNSNLEYRTPEKSHSCVTVYKRNHVSIFSLDPRLPYRRILQWQNKQKKKITLPRSVLRVITLGWSDDVMSRLWLMDVNRIWSVRFLVSGVVLTGVKFTIHVKLQGVRWTWIIVTRYLRHKGCKGKLKY